MPSVSTLVLALRSNANDIRILTSFATHKRLRPEQVTAVTTMLNEPHHVQMAKIFAAVLANENALARFQAAKPKFQINSDLKTNLTRAVNLMLFSRKITEYKGDVAKNTVQTLLLRVRHHWGNFVVGTEHDKSSMDVVSKFLGDVLTVTFNYQERNREVRRSPSPRTRQKGEEGEAHSRPLTRRDAHHNLPAYKAYCSKALRLFQCLIAISQRKLHVRTIEQSLNTEEFWDFVDIDLEKIHATARKDTTDANEIAKRVARAFAAFLGADHKRHGSNASEEIPDVTTASTEAAIAYQEDIDDNLDARHRAGVAAGPEASGSPVEDADEV
ncbi:hypothetical protein K438DRAFT_2092440 [Mycena galopus ATCC 62051]|nr:hypothetical protein K438DRAFT_2092440 [Mycena galopus ATCC 62051]